LLTEKDRNRLRRLNLDFMDLGAFKKLKGSQITHKS